MSSSMFVVALLAVVCGVSDAFLQDLLLQPLQHLQQAVLPQQQQPHYYQYAQYPQQYHQQYQQYQAYPQYRRAGEPQPLPAVQQHGVYANSRPVLYQWQQQWQQPQSYGSAYSYSSNPLSSLLQGSWLPWASAGRQPVQAVQAVQAPSQPLQAQPLQGGPVISTQQLQAQPQQPQQPLQAFWALLPWNSNAAAASQQQQQQQQPGPILSFLQNPAAVLPWGQASQQASRPVYTTPLAPAPAPAAVPVSASLSAGPGLQVAAEAPSVKPTGVVLDDVPATSAFSSNGIRRVALHDVVQADVHADALPCAQDA